MEAGRIIDARWGCQSFRPVGANTAGLCDLDMDQLVRQAERTLDETPRNALLKQAQDIVAEQAPSIWLLQITQAAGMSRKLHDPALMKTEVLTVNEHTWLEA